MALAAFKQEEFADAVNGVIWLRGMDGVGQGNALTGPAFVMVIDEAMKSTEEKFGITIRAIQDDMTLLGDAKFIFGTNGNNGALTQSPPVCT